jgi:hypothetical protein
MKFTNFLSFSIVFSMTQAFTLTGQGTPPRTTSNRCLILLPKAGLSYDTSSKGGNIIVNLYLLAWPGGFGLAHLYASLKVA